MHSRSLNKESAWGGGGGRGVPRGGGGGGGGCYHVGGTNLRNAMTFCCPELLVRGQVWQASPVYSTYTSSLQHRRCILTILVLDIRDT